MRLSIHCVGMRRSFVDIRDCLRGSMELSKEYSNKINWNHFIHESLCNSKEYGLVVWLGDCGFSKMDCKSSSKAMVWDMA